ncbi:MULTISPECIES: ATP-binding protein [Sphingobacterium]|mgnify:CR=1 FL=1|uniref:ATP-binding protein n=1 Tax=Sphingobacterium TaxID=28453 RepID=UPI000E006D6D|nr:MULTISPECIES: ATP-binding protein [Sphingobacterium]QQT47176.1 putative DNA binding domain-containing protein [Sphingobacterium multivorum]SUJ13382.1 Divergent AAA domain [Sphingobacterium multivorum]
MPEQQNIEYKESWHDEYLKWVCGFANAQGGVIYIGKDDNGNVVGLKDYKKLMDDIPNKIRNAMGITVEVNLHEQTGNHFIEIITHPYSVPISWRGRYYYRSGSTKQELTGNALNEFLLKKSGKTWDDVIEPRATFDDIDENTFFAFLRMSNEKGRMPETDGLTIEQAFDKLLLTENGQLKRASIILFGKNPARFYPNTFVKVGYFKGNDILFHDVVEGNLVTLLREVSNLLNFKYFTKKIHFEGLYRIETGEYPAPAIREMLLNALIHRNYMGSMTQIRIYDDSINIWNDGTLPVGINSEILKKPHRSNPRNPLIADVCFKGGLIDSWGSGTIRIIETCKQANLPEPELIEQEGGFSVTLFKNSLTAEQLAKLGLNDRQLKAVEYVKEKGKITNKEYQELNDTTDRTALRDIETLITLGVLRRVGEKKGAYYELVI